MENDHTATASARFHLSRALTALDAEQKLFTGSSSALSPQSAPTLFPAEAPKTAPPTASLIPPATVITATAKKTHKKKGREGVIPRPPNAFILYRSFKQPALVAECKGEGKSSRDFSQRIGVMWADETPAVRSHFQALAAERMKQHRIAYPEYKYRASSSSTNNHSNDSSRKNKASNTKNVNNINSNRKNSVRCLNVQTSGTSLCDSQPLGLSSLSSVAAIALSQFSTLPGDSAKLLSRPSSDSTPSVASPSLSF
ncbi:hypothetical protein HK100_012401, partial [Physocladia obscura]